MMRSLSKPTLEHVAGLLSPGTACMLAFMQRKEGLGVCSQHMLAVCCEFNDAVVVAL